MKRADLEARFIEMLMAGGEPMDDPEIRDAAALDAELAAELGRLREITLKLDGLEWPEMDYSLRIDRMTQAFEEGYRQGRAHATELVPHTPWFGKMWQVAALGAAVFVGVVAGSFLWNGRGSSEQVRQLRADMQGLHELVAVSMLENTSASDRLRGLQYARDLIDPGPRLINGLSATLRSDQNANVRLAAAEAMVRFADHQEVRDALHEVVMTEDPFMQVQLIDVLLIVRDRDPQSRDILTRLASSPTEVVRAKATAALNQTGD